MCENNANNGSEAILAILGHFRGKLGASWGAGAPLKHGKCEILLPQGARLEPPVATQVLHVASAARTTAAMSALTWWWPSWLTSTEENAKGRRSQCGAG